MTPENWSKGRCVRYNGDDVPYKFDLAASLCMNYMDLSGIKPQVDLEDLILLNKMPNLDEVYEIFLSAYEQVHGTVKNEQGNPIRSTIKLVKLTAINDGGTHEELIRKLYSVVEMLG